MGKNSVMTPYDYTVRAYLAKIKNAIDLGAKCTTGQGEIAEWRSSRNGIIPITGLHIAIATVDSHISYSRKAGGNWRSLHGSNMGQIASWA